MIINALRKEPHISHFSLDQALEIIRELQVKQAYITHIGHQMGLSTQVSAELPSNVRLAHDMLTFEI